MDNFPIFLDIKNKPILVVGGGEIALRKVFLLNKAAPKINVVAKSFSKDLIDLATQFSTGLQILCTILKFSVLLTRPQDKGKQTNY